MQKISHNAVNKQAANGGAFIPLPHPRRPSILAAMLRWASWLVVLLYGALLGVALCRRTAAPVISSAPPPVPLTVYYEKDPLPVELFAQWAARQHVAVTQRPLTFTAGAWPADGDLYVVSPRWLASLRQQIPLRAPADGQLARAVNPAFTSQPFDADNQFTVPWRWTPYVVYERHTYVITGLPPCLWIGDMELPQALSGLRNKVSANQHADGDINPGTVDPKTLASEVECWRAFLANEIKLAILPAAYLEQHHADPRLTDVRLRLPNGEMRGTIIHLDLFATPADGDPERQRLADDLARHLLEEAQQQRLVTASGYFPVVTKLGHEFDFAPVPLPREHWFNRSEFLIDRPPAGAEFTGMSMDYLFDGGSILLDFDNSDNAHTYILVKHRDAPSSNPDYQQFFIAQRPDLKDRVEIIEGGTVEKVILAKAEKFLASNRSDQEMKTTLHRFIKLMSNRQLQWRETGEGTWKSIRRIDTSHPLVREVFVTGSDAATR